MSKGSKPRPFDREKFNTNWDRIFNKADLEYESDNPLERPFVKYQQSLTELNHDGNYGIGREGEMIEAS